MNEAAGFDELPGFINSWQTPLGCEIHYSLAVLVRKGFRREHIQGD